MHGHREEKEDLLLPKTGGEKGETMPTGTCTSCFTPVSWNYCFVHNAMRLFWVSSAVGIFGGMSLLLGLTGKAFSRQCPDYAPYYYHGCFTIPEFLGVVFCVLFVPVGVLFLGASIQLLSRRVHDPSQRTFVVMGLLSLAVLILTFVTFVMYYMVEPQLTFYPKIIDHLLVFIGGFLVTVFTPIAILCLVLAADFSDSFQSCGGRRRWGIQRPAGRTASEMGRMGYAGGTTGVAASSSSSRLAPSNSFMPAEYPREPLEPNSFALNWRMIAWGGCVLMVAYWMTCTLSCIWVWYSGSYFTIPSPYSLWVWIVSDKFSFKFYKDTLVYYGFLFAILLIGALAHFEPCLRSCTSKRLKVHPTAHRWYFPYPYGVSVGELIVLACVFGLFIWWYNYWRWDYKRIVDKAMHGEDPAYKPDDNAELNIAARVTGHICSLSMAFLMLPVAKNSLWESALGIPFERALKYHRGMGVVFYILMTLHMLMWWVKWIHEGIFWHNLTRVDYFKINKVDNHFEDFTVNLMTILWFGATIMIIIAIWFRRSNYNLFYITHLFSIILLVGTIMHAWSFWFFAVGPCFLWFYDRMVRLRRASATTVPLIAMDYSPATGVTRLELPQETFKFYAGQYAYLQLASLSPFAWHPFTVSSAPSAPSRTFHIKAEAPGTWTYRLARLAESYAGSPSLPVIAVDAAYGRGNYIEGHTSLLMVGGGIGITPFTSLVTELYTRMCLAERNGLPLERPLKDLKKVHLVFTARSEAMLCMFSSLFFAISKHNPRGIFQVDLHATGGGKPIEVSARDLESQPSGGDDSEPAALAYTRSRIIRSRPNLATIARELEHHSPRRSTLAMACGPTAVVDSTSDLAFTHSFNFHHEVFHF